MAALNKTSVEPSVVNNFSTNLDSTAKFDMDVSKKYSNVLYTLTYILNLLEKF